MNKIIAIIVVLFGIHSIFAAGTNPPPPPPTPPPPPGLQLDSMAIILFFLALVLGFYSLKKYIFIKKGS